MNYNVEPLRTKTEVTNLTEALEKPRDRFLLLLGMNTGLRISDLVRLTVGDIRNKANTKITEQKTGKTRRLELRAVAEDIASYCANKLDDAFLFPSRKGDKPISTTQAYRVLTQAGEKLGRNDIGTHTMRKTFGYHYYKKTKDVVTLMEIFGHAAPDITKRYIGIRDEEIADTLKDFRIG